MLHSFSTLVSKPEHAAHKTQSGGSAKWSTLISSAQATSRFCEPAGVRVSRPHGQLLADGGHDVRVHQRAAHRPRGVRDLPAPRLVRHHRARAPLVQGGLTQQLPQDRLVVPEGAAAVAAGAHKWFLKAQSCMGLGQPCGMRPRRHSAEFCVCDSAGAGSDARREMLMADVITPSLPPVNRNFNSILKDISILNVPETQLCRRWRGGCGSTSTRCGSLATRCRRSCCSSWRTAASPWSSSRWGPPCSVDQLHSDFEVVTGSHFARNFARTPFQA